MSERIQKALEVLKTVVTASRLTENLEGFDIDAEEVYIRDESACLVSKHIFLESIVKIWQADEEIEQTTSKEQTKLREILKSTIFDCLTNQIELSNSTVTDLINKIKSELPLESWEVFRPLYGAKLSSCETLELGCYKVYSIAKYQELIKTIPNFNLVANLSSITPKNHLVISFKVKDKARDPDKAQEIADTKFHQFDNIIRYMLGSSNNSLDIGVFEYIGTYLSKTTVISPTRGQSSSSIHGVLQPVELDGRFPVSFEGMDQEPFSSSSPQYFKNPQIGHDWIWNVLSNSNPTKLQSRLITAIEWVGKAIRDNDNARAFVQVVFALESIFTFQEKNVLVSPSIANQIAESIAFILGTNLDERIKYEKEAKNIYSNRSAIAHGGSKSISRIDLDQAINFVKKVICKMTTDSTYTAMTTVEDFSKWMQKQKYSWGENAQNDVRTY